MHRMGRTHWGPFAKRLAAVPGRPDPGIKTVSFTHISMAT